MYAMMVKQGLMAMGIRDEKVNRVIDRLAEGGALEDLKLESLTDHAILVPPGADTMCITGKRGTEKYTLVLFCEKSC
jgi:hypothetical protein